jgi:7-carboxy-7-deazaguanine synthase
MTGLRITEIFFSIQGESQTVGLPTIFIRLTGCPLRCQYCDTAYAFKGGKVLSIDEIIQKVKQYKTKNICITGGEPLAQVNSHNLITALCDMNYSVSIETSGALSVANIDRRAHIVMDLKTPGSREENKNLYTNIDYLKPDDEIKFVICDRSDYVWSCEIMHQYNLIDKAKVLFSASWQQLNPTELADWIIQDGLEVRFQLQLHKILWNDAPGR